ncbi:hypothetical protein [Oceanospirillum maris]|uniref:hypothetical protein n=1 Tax=Oceanospirillum maris TaxID=64977 RepID=UPI0003FF3D20|nr:hypothetical protein [Oceanospirillum maris]
MNVFSKAAKKRIKGQQVIERQGVSKGAISKADSEDLLESIRDVIQEIAISSDMDRAIAVEHLNRLKEKHRKILAGKCIRGPQG